MSELSNSGEGSKMTEEDVFRIAKSAIIVLELEKIKEDFFDAEWGQRAEVLKKISKYSNHTTKRVSREVFSFLLEISNMTGGGMTSSAAKRIESLVSDYLPLRMATPNFKELASQGIRIANNIYYYSSITLKDLSVGIQALQILNSIYSDARNRGLNDLKQEVLKAYLNLESQLDRPDGELKDSQELLQNFKDDLDKVGSGIPLLSKNLQMKTGI